MSATYALLVGIDAYAAPVPQLRGCVNDIEAVSELLQARTSPGQALHLRMLRDGEATRTAVEAGFREHLSLAGPQDAALFYYSGHGSQAPAPQEFWDIEPDRLLETLVLYDSRDGGVFDLADKELAALLHLVAAKGAHVAVVLDCCHSGSGTRRVESDPVRERLAPRDDRARPLESFVPEVLASIAGAGSQPRAVASQVERGEAGRIERGAGGSAQRADGVGVGGTEGRPARAVPAAVTGTARHVLLAACRSRQTAKEVTDEGRSHGAFSWALQAAVREAGGVVSYRDVHRWAQAAVRNRVSDQSPQLEVVAAGDLDIPFLGGAIQPGPRYYTLSHDRRDGWLLDAGAVHGIPAPVGEETTVLAVFELGAGETASERFAQALASARVTQVLPDRSTVAVAASDAVELDEGRTYRARVVAIPLPPLAVRLLGAAEGLRALRAAIEHTGEALLQEVAAEGEVVVQAADGGGFRIFRPGARADRVTVVDGPDAVARTVVTLQHIARWMRLARLRNPASSLPASAVEVKLTAPDGSASTTELTLDYAVTPAGRLEQPSFVVSLRNATDRRLWCALIDLTETYGVFTDAFAAGSVELAPGESTSVKLYGEVADALAVQGIRELTDQLKVVVSTVEFDPRTLEQDELDVRASALTVRAAPTLPTSTLERLMRTVTTRRASAKPSAGELVADWLTADVFVTVRRPEGGGASSAVSPA